jgi:hypothetical protein
LDYSGSPLAPWIPKRARARGRPIDHAKGPIDHCSHCCLPIKCPIDHCSCCCFSIDGCAQVFGLDRVGCVRIAARGSKLARLILGTPLEDSRALPSLRRVDASGLSTLQNYCTAAELVFRWFEALPVGPGEARNKEKGPKRALEELGDSLGLWKSSWVPFPLYWLSFRVSGTVANHLKMSFACREELLAPSAKRTCTISDKKLANGQ